MKKQLVDVDGVLAGLKDFQRASARYVFDRMYAENDPSLRFLVADEVGLGKTLVAKGVIALAVDHLRSIGDRRIDIVYVCSNSAIARQNVAKLNVTESDVITLATRFTMLAAQGRRLSQERLNIVAVTPGTSLKFGHSAGMFPERALLFAFLQAAWGRDVTSGAGPARLFYWGITDDKDARPRLRREASTYELPNRIVTQFRKELQGLNARRKHDGRPTVRAEFDELVEEYRYRRSFPDDLRAQRNRFIAELREGLATVGIKALEPDLVILDEFQRFKSLLDPEDESWANRLARDLFDYRDRKSDRPTRTLLLSATPYRMYTGIDDGAGDDHHDDLVHTARFLFDRDEPAEALRGELRSLRASFLDLAADGGASARAACDAVTARLRKVMVRTERLASTPDRNGMLTTLPLANVALEVEDIRGYRTLARLTELLGQHDALEYWKSGPYLLNFMERYALKQAFDERAASGEPVADLAECLATGHGLLPWQDVVRYQRIDPGNARLRALMKDLDESDVWALLWLPPSRPYYVGGSEFEAPPARKFTKRLVFSAWHLVPKVIATLVSYEAERRAFQASAESRSTRYTTEFSRRPGRRLDFAVEDGHAGGMTSFAFVYPCVALARLADPRVLGAQNGGSVLDRASVVAEARRRIEDALRRHVSGRATSGNIDPRWYWAALLLLDADLDDSGDEWFRALADTTNWTGSDDQQDEGRFGQHLEEAWKWLDGDRGLGRVPDDLVDVLAELAVGGPATVALRALGRVCGGADSYSVPEVRSGAARVAWGFRSLFNGPEVTAIVRARGEEDNPYWRAAIAYCIDGNLQAVMDEYAHVARDWRGLIGRHDSRVAKEVAESVYAALTLRTATYATDVPSIAGDTLSLNRHFMRGRFAARFGDLSGEDGAQQRADQVSTAFNSPFWPFVLATTSIGQEGLDFHLYCHAVVHWNLPSNPVDMEQREGRVHRFKGHAVRKNVAALCGGRASDESQPDPWDAMFDAACAMRPKGESEIVPFWVFNPDGTGATIQRLLAILPLSREVGRLHDLIRAIASYRLAFGQPRQEDLVEYLQGAFTAEELAHWATELRVDLSPPVRAV